MPTQKSERNEIKYKYSKYEVVWAKISGYPWWPACITCTPSKTNCFYKVDFIGDRSYAFLSERQIANYAQFRDQYELNKKSNNKNFLNAVTMAGIKYQQFLLKKGCILKKSKSSVEYKTSQQKYQLNQQIQLAFIHQKIKQITTQNKKNIKSTQQIIHNNTIVKSIKQTLENKQKQTKVFQQKIQEQIYEEKQSVKQNQEMRLEDEQHIMQVQQEQKQDRQKIIEQLLIKYKLYEIPNLRESKKQQNVQNNQNKIIVKKLHWKRKLIGKQKSYKDRERQQNSNICQFGQEQLITRKIYRYLMKKLHSIQGSMPIALNLKQQIINEKANKFECIKKVIEWISISEPQSIMNFHFQWINFYKDTERQKPSCLTIEGESQQHFIK